MAYFLALGMNRYSNVQKFGGRLGQISGRGLQTISKFERDITKFDKDVTGGLVGELYKVSPFKVVYDSYMTPVKSTLKFTKGLGTALELKKPQYAIKAGLDVFAKNDPMLRFSGQSESPFYRVAQSPYFLQFS